MAKLGADISDYQSGYTASVYAKHQEYIIFKATEGLSVNDKFFKARREEARKAGTKVGIYHFAHPGSNRASDEAQHFLDVIGHKLNSNEWVLLDLEVKHNGISNADLNAWVDTWTTLVGRALNHVGGIYSYDSFLRENRLLTSAVNGWWLHAANYKSGSYGSVPAPWKRYTFWQFTGDGVGGSPHTLPGISDRNIDVNRYDGSSKALDGLTAGAKKPITPVEYKRLSAKEGSWVHEYDQLKASGKNLPRRIYLRGKIRVQAAIIKRKAGKSGWGARNYKYRYSILSKRS